MKNWELINLFGKTFEQSTKHTVSYSPITYRDIDDCYGRPSENKRSIWKQWERWFNGNNGYCTVASHSCHFFTIEGYVKDSETDEMWFCRITPSHNYCFKVD